MSKQGNRLINGPWLSNEALARLPAVHRAFDMNRDPYIRCQLLDQDKTESQRREEQSGRGSAMVKTDKPAPAYRPSTSTSRAVDRESFRERWLAEQRDAVMARASRQQPSNERQREVSRSYQSPSR